MVSIGKSLFECFVKFLSSLFIYVFCSWWERRISFFIGFVGYRSRFCKYSVELRYLLWIKGDVDLDWGEREGVVIEEYIVYRVGQIFINVLKS